MAGDSDAWLCSDVLSDSFPSTSRLEHFAGLMVPQAFANVFFDAAGAASLGSVRSPESRLGCVQLLPATLRREALDAMTTAAAQEYLVLEKTTRMFFIQSVAVRPGARRRGHGAALMRWAEEEAVRKAAQLENQVVPVELWLAVDADEAPALALHQRCGYEIVTNMPAFGNNLLLRKKIGAESHTRSIEESSSGDKGDTSQTASLCDDSATAIVRPGPSVGALLRELGAQSAVVLVAALGISLLLAPFGGRSLGALFSGGGRGGSLLALFGATAGLGSEVLRRLFLISNGASAAAPSHGGFWSSLDLDEDLLAECRADESLRSQKAVVARVAGWGRGGGIRDGGSGSDSSLAPSSFVMEAIFLTIWQGSVALSEEVYYRGFLQSGMASLFGSGGTAVGGGLVGAGDFLALVLASIIFGAVHVLWVDDTGESDPQQEARQQQKFDWFVETGAWGLLYGSVFWVSGYHLLAPVAAHASQNIWWNLEDVRSMARAEPEDLAELFPFEGEIRGG